MADLKAYYATLRATKAALDARHPEGCLYITSLANPATGSTSGAVTQVSTMIAATAFLGKNAREATPSEIEAEVNRGKSLLAITNCTRQRARKNAAIEIREVKHEQ